MLTRVEHKGSTFDATEHARSGLRRYNDLSLERNVLGNLRPAVVAISANRSASLVGANLLDLTGAALAGTMPRRLARNLMRTVGPSLGLNDGWRFYTRRLGSTLLVSGYSTSRFSHGFSPVRLVPVIENSVSLRSYRHVRDEPHRSYLFSLQAGGHDSTRTPAIHNPVLRGVNRFKDATGEAYRGRAGAT
jgi:hypothetical protein